MKRSRKRVPVDHEPHLTQGSTLTFHDVYYRVKVKTPGKLCSRHVKDILISVSGIFKPGMNVILGPTGSGKSSLLDILAGRKEPKGLSGTLLVDGRPQHKNFKTMTGYVVQDDLITGTLTVRENLMFSASLRLPTTMSHKDKVQRVDEILCELGLEKCADSKIGTEFIRGVSGGERKRTSIGMELIIEPPVLFLDEPTTGLDSSTAFSVISLLHSLSQRGRTIIFSIHQPRYTIYKMFDRLMLLSEGRTVYHGLAKEALEYFEKIGYVCEDQNNPSDFFLDVILGEEPPPRSDHVPKKPLGYGQTESNGNYIVTSFSALDEIFLNDDESGKVETRYPEREEMATYLADKFSKSSQCRELHAEIDAIYCQYQKRMEVRIENQRMVQGYATPFTSQVRTLSKRAALNFIRNPRGTIMQAIMTTIMSLVIGSIYVQLDNDVQSGIQNRVGALFFICMNMAFSNISAVVIFITERALFIHEHMSGFYKVSSYFVAKTIFDILPLRLIPTTAYTLVTYFMIGFRLKAQHFFIYYLTLLLTTCSAASIAFFSSCLTHVFPVANLLTSLTLALMMIFGGFLVNMDTMASWLSWLGYLSLFRYAFKGLLINELKDQVFCEKGNHTEICFDDLGNRYLGNQGIAFETAWDLWQNPLGLICMTSFFLILSFITLHFVPKHK